jgi:hypothetical protein
MPDREGPSTSEFAASFPDRLVKALDDARGAMAGISASARAGRIDAATLRSLHEIYRLKVELELETAAILWRTAEIARALGDAIQVIERRRKPGELVADPWLGTIDAEEVAARRGRLSSVDERRGNVAHLRRRPPTDAEAA